MVHAVSAARVNLRTAPLAYFEQVAEIIFTDSTCSCWPLAPLDVVLREEDELDAPDSTRPVISI